MANVIETKELVKQYGEKRAVDHVSVHVEKGDIYGLIGKNGAGKTTLMRLLLGLADKSEGEIELFGGTDLNAARYRIGSIIEEPGLYLKETAFENMKRFSLLHENVTDEEIREILNKVGLGDTGKKKAGQFSLGMRQRLGLGIALLGKPELMILDEPINGLDPAGIKENRDMILKLNEEGVTFMISSHLLDELGKIATRYGIMADGVLVEEITAGELNDRCRKHIAVTVNDVKKAKEALALNKPDLEMEDDPEKNTVKILTEVDDTSEVAEILVKAGVRVYSLSQQGSAVEDYFIEKLGGAR